MSFRDRNIRISFVSKFSASMSANRNPNSEYRIQVFPRFRALQATESKASHNKHFQVNERQVNVILPHGGKRYIFDKVLKVDANQESVFNHAVLPFLKDMLVGYNCTILTYGQANTGKSHTIRGPDDAFTSPPSAETGCIPRTLHYLLTTLKEQSREFIMHMSFIQFSKDIITDLFAKPNAKLLNLRMVDDKAKKGSVIIQCLEEVAIHEYDEFLTLFNTATKTIKANTSHPFNHCVFILKIEVRDFAGSFKEAKLTFVDLAGSESAQSRSASSENLQTEQVDLSLQAFHRIIEALKDKQSYVPYKDSKLTRLLQESFGGNAKIAVIATLSPIATHLDQTLNTLDLATKARSITKNIQVNQELNCHEIEKRYMGDIERLRQDLKAAKAKSGIYVNMDNYNALVNETQTHRENLQRGQEQKIELTKRIHDMQHKKNEMEDSCAISKSDLESVQDSVRVQQANIEQMKTVKSSRDQIIADYEQYQALMIQKSAQLSEDIDRNIADRNLLRTKVDNAYDNMERNQDAQQKFQAMHDDITSSFFAVVDKHKENIRKSAETEEIQYSLDKESNAESSRLFAANFRQLCQLDLPDMQNDAEKHAENLKQMLQINDEQWTTWFGDVGRDFEEFANFAKSVTSSKTLFMKEYDDFEREQKALIAEKGKQFAEEMNEWKTESLEMLHNVEEHIKAVAEFCSKYSNPEKDERESQLCKLLDDTMSELIAIKKDEKKECDLLERRQIDQMKNVEQRGVEILHTITNNTTKYCEGIEAINESLSGRRHTFQSNIENLMEKCDDEKISVTKNNEELMNTYLDHNERLSANVLGADKQLKTVLNHKIDESHAVINSATSLRNDIAQQIEENRECLHGFEKAASKRSQLTSEDCRETFDKAINLMNEMSKCVNDFLEDFEFLAPTGDTPVAKEHKRLPNPPKVPVWKLEEFNQDENTEDSLNESFESARQTRLQNTFDTEGNEGEYRGEYVTTQHAKN